ncbi:hypothetical protein AVEN_104353-1 [Araneus ventricosus]|uniref:Uncharacterized protein n=1 Tax=Araneus ventricosus TaxID=182803 RepID=A0A4Y2BX19_ARAVE|nr:hypothetical protein AVEN_104353-1 [Araneus ventricosus]
MQNALPVVAIPLLLHPSKQDPSLPDFPTNSPLILPPHRSSSLTAGFAFQSEHPPALKDRILLLLNGLNGKQTMLDFQIFPMLRQFSSHFTFEGFSMLRSKNRSVLVMNDSLKISYLRVRHAFYYQRFRSEFRNYRQRSLN